MYPEKMSRQILCIIKRQKMYLRRIFCLSYFFLFFYYCVSAAIFAFFSSFVIIPISNCCSTFRDLFKVVHFLSCNADLEIILIL